MNTVTWYVWMVTMECSFDHLILFVISRDCEGGGESRNGARGNLSGFQQQAPSGGSSAGDSDFLPLFQ